MGMALIENGWGKMYGRLLLSFGSGTLARTRLLDPAKHHGTAAGKIKLEPFHANGTIQVIVDSEVPHSFVNIAISSEFGIVARENHFVFARRSENAIGVK